MKALGKLKAEKGLWMYDAPIPEIGSEDVLIRIQKTGVCGTDLHIYKWDNWAQNTIPVPLTIGHEFYGIIEKVGKDVTHLKPGDRVSGEGHIHCNSCRPCRLGNGHVCKFLQWTGIERTGCFAEYLSFPAQSVILLPDEISDDVASFLDPLGNAVHTALSFDVIGEDVLITGAGPIGCMAAAICKFIGAKNIVVTDRNDYRLKIAKKMGATHTINVQQTSLLEAIQDIGLEEKFDVGLEMTGSAQAFQEMVLSMNNCGKMALLGILPDDASINWTKVILQGLYIKGIFGREVFRTWEKMIGMLKGGLDITPVITHRFKADDFEKAFEVMFSGESGKVILDWT